MQFLGPDLHGRAFPVTYEFATRMLFAPEYFLCKTGIRSLFLSQAQAAKMSKASFFPTSPRYLTYDAERVAQTLRGVARIHRQKGEKKKKKKDSILGRTSGWSGKIAFAISV